MKGPSTAFGGPAAGQDMVGPCPAAAAPLQLQGRKFGERAAALSGLAARLLGWRPGEFWAATPAELAAALHDEAHDPVEGDELERLMARFPDKEP
jgi:uncharacterized phage protein (TIGR02216 family)